VEYIPTNLEPEIRIKKQSILDVLCTDKNGSKYIIEMQNAKEKGFEKRAVYYASKTYATQMDKGGKYSDLKEVIFIAITDFVMFPEKEAYISTHSIRDTETNEHDLKDFSFAFIELPKYKKHDGAQGVDEWCDLFKYAAKTSEADLKRIIGSDLVIEHAYEALNQFNWNETELIAYEQEIKRIMDNRAADDYIRDKRQEIEARGKAEGKAEGETKKAIEIAKKMLIKGKDIAEIIEFTDLSKEQIEKLKSS